MTWGLRGGGWSTPAIAVATVVALVAGVGGAVALTGDRRETVQVAPEPVDPCTLQTRNYVDRLQLFVDGAAKAPQASGPTSAAIDLKAESKRYADLLQFRGCDLATAKETLTEELKRLKGDGPLGSAVARVLSARLLAPPGEKPVRRDVAVGADLAAIAAEVPPASTLHLAPGRHVLAEQLILLQPVTLEGDGQERTVVASAASGAAVLFLGAGRLVLDRLAVVHEGAAAAHVVVVPAGGYAVRSSRISGGVAGSRGDGGVGLLVASARSTGRRGEVTAATLSGNARAGMAIVAADSPAIARSTFTDNRGCGLCLAGSSRAHVVDSRFVRNGVGLEVSGTAAPLVERGSASGNRSIGVALRQQAGGTVRDMEIARNGVVGVVADARSTTQVVGNVVRDQAKVGVAVTGSARATIRGNRIERNGLGLQVDGASAPLITGNVVIGSGKAAGLFAGTTTARLERNACIGGTPGWLVAGTARPQVRDDACRLVRQR